MIRQAPPGLATLGGDHVDVEVAVLIPSVGDQGAVRGKMGTAQQAGASDQAVGGTTCAADDPDVAATGESDLGLWRRTGWLLRNPKLTRH